MEFNQFMDKLGQKVEVKVGGFMKKKHSAIYQCNKEDNKRRDGVVGVGVGVEKVMMVSVDVQVGEDEGKRKEMKDEATEV